MSKTLTIACRLPAGLLAEVGAEGSEGYRAFHIKGVHTPGAIIENGHALTNVPEDFWNAFAEAHKGAEYLKNRLVYASGSLQEARAGTKLAETAGKTGFEPVNPDTPVQDVEVDRERLAKNLSEVKALSAAQNP